MGGRSDSQPGACLLCTSSQGMLREAGELKAQRQLGHVELLQMDAVGPSQPSLTPTLTLMPTPT